MLQETSIESGGQIDFNSIQAEAVKLTGDSGTNCKRIEHHDVLHEILDSLDKDTDFRTLANVDANENVNQKQLVVCTVDEILKAAKKLNCGLCRNNDFLFTYNGAFWQLLERAELETFLAKGAAQMGVDRITARYHKFSESLFRQFLAVANLPKPEPAPNKVLINLQNGTFEVSAANFALRDYNRKDFLTYQLPFAFDKTAKCPKWQAFLDEVLPDKSRQTVLAEFFGYIFTSLKLEKTLLLYGSGANGKSVVFDVLTALLGSENISHYSLASLKHDYQRAMLSNKLLNYASEISNRLESDVFKKLTSGEPVEARLPYGQPFIMRRYARLAFNCNELPRDVEHNEAFFRRFLIIPFEVTITEENRNPNLAREIIAGEMSGVFNWLLRGLQRLLKQNKFSPCDAANKARETYRRESDSAAMFVEEMNYQKVSDGFDATFLKTIYGDYKMFCQDYGFHPLNIQNLGNRLRANGFNCPKTKQGILVYAKRS